MSNPDDAGGYRVDAGSSEAGRTTTITGSTGTTSTGPAAGRRKLHFSMTPVSRRRDKSEGYMDTDEDDDDAENTSPEYDGDGEDDAWSVPGSPKAATTPTFQQSYANLRRNLSVKSLRELELKHVQSKLWRKQGEIRKRPRDLEQLAIHAASGAAREWTFRIRSCECRADPPHRRLYSGVQLAKRGKPRHNASSAHTAAVRRSLLDALCHY